MTARRPARESNAAADASLPLLRRFPALAALSRVRLGTFPTPLEHIDAALPGLWVKREDMTGEPLGGNKVRSLEFLLGGVRPGDRVTTVGAAGSTHVLATVTYARVIGAEPLVYRWRQEMNPIARRVAERITRELGNGHAPVSRTIAGAYARALLARLRGARWVPAGGSTPLGVLGQVNAGLELAQQIADGLMPPPDRVVVPLGTGGTAAGIALGLGVAGLRTAVVGVRVVPRIVANRAHIRRLIAQTARLIERMTKEPVAQPVPIRVVHHFYGGAYGRATAAGDVATQRASRSGIAIDATYSAKALAAAIDLAELHKGTTLFWLSFDGRWLPPGDVVALGRQR